MTTKKHIRSISYYRTEIMGYAILGVMLAHCKTICDLPDTIVTKVIGFLCYSVFTGGFVFLSGLGLYSSLNKNSNIKDFFKKRAIRLLIPYVLISLPFFVFTDVIIGKVFFPFLEHITTISFWIHVNYSGMWYISLSVALYLLYPLLHKFLYGEYYKENRRFSICMIGTSLLLLLLSYLVPNYYDMTSIAFSKLPLFIMGSYTMCYVSNDFAKYPPQLWLSIISLVISISICLAVDLNNIWIIINTVSIIVLSVLFEWLSKLQIAKWVLAMFNWLGRYTLELYMLHLLIYYFFNAIDSNYTNGVHIVMAVAISIISCKPVHELVTKVTRLVIR